MVYLKMSLVVKFHKIPKNKKLLNPRLNYFYSNKKRGVFPYRKVTLEDSGAKISR